MHDVDRINIIFLLKEEKRITRNKYLLQTISARFPKIKLVIRPLPLRYEALDLTIFFAQEILKRKEAADESDQFYH